MDFKNINLEIPFDTINLPSGGFFYPDKLSSITVRYLTAKEEVVLTAPSLMENGQAMDIVLKSTIMNEGVDINKLLVGDRDAILIYLRSTSYGDNLPVIITCPSCGKSGETSFTLSKLLIKDINEKPDQDGNFSFILPKMKLSKSNVEIKFKPLTVETELEIFKESELNKKIENNVTLKYKHQIVSINDNLDKNYIYKVIKNIPILDSSKLREYMDYVEPGFDNNVNFSCPSCQHEFQHEFHIGNNFFGLTPQYRQHMLEEIFLSYYYGKGITRQDAYNMTVTERKWTIERISEEIDKKNKAEQDAVNKSKSKR